MSWLRLNNFEYAGYVNDVDAHLLPPNLVSRLENAHGNDGVLEVYPGYNEYAPTGEIEAPFWLLSGGFNSPWLLSAGANTIESLAISGSLDITPALGLTTVERNAWTGGVLHGIALLNNQSDPPQYWTGAGDAADLPNWLAGETCGALRPFKNFVFAGNLTDGAGSYPTKVRWSTAADPGAVPASWDDTDATVDAGSLTLSDTPGAVVDFQASNNSMFCYKEDAVYEFTYVGGLYIFKNAPRFYQFGLLTKNCTFSYRGVNYAFGNDDIVRHTSTEMQSIATKTVRRRIFGQLVATYKSRSFVMFDQIFSELLFCVPMNSEFVDYAFTYNPVTGKWGERSLPQINHGTTGKLVLTPDSSWDDDTNSWDSDVSIWNPELALNNQSILGGVQLYALNETYSHNGAAIPVIMERKSLDFGTEQSPNERIKFVSRVRPNIIADVGVQVQVQLGSQMKLGDTVSWTAAQTFTVGTDRDLCFRVNGRYISWRISSTNTDLWKLESIDVDVKMGAMW